MFSGKGIIIIIIIIIITIIFSETHKMPPLT